MLDNDYLIQVAYLDANVREALEKEFLEPRYEIHARYMVDESNDPAVLKDLPVRPPQVWRYFCRARSDVLDRFIADRELRSLEKRRAEDEFVYQTSFSINLKYYASGKMTAFVMSQGRDMIIMKVVGYAEDVIRFYRMEDFTAHAWIGHQRYPTKGRVWHPGGAHPFMGLDEGLVHNGDFANYHSVSEYLAQRNVKPLFLTDTEVSVLLFDLLNRAYGYPLEYIIEALAPTTERDFHQLPEEKQKVYQAIQRAHMHGSPDGPWFFIIARNCYYEGKQQLIGITDTSMLQAAGLRHGGGGHADRAGGLGEAGHRRRPSFHQRRPPLGAQAGGRLLERPRRQPHRRRRLRLQHRARERQEEVGGHEQVRVAGGGQAEIRPVPGPAHGHRPGQNLSLHQR